MNYDAANQKETIMRSMSYTLLAAVLLLFSTQVLAGNSTNEERNKQNVVEFYNKAINDKDFEAAEKYIGDTYIQHNPIAADGKEGLKNFLTFARENLPQYHSEIKKVFADGNYVILHVHARRTPEDRGSAVMDIFRLDENGKVVEHWDVVQEIPPPEQTNNDNTMF